MSTQPVDNNPGAKRNPISQNPYVGPRSFQTGERLYGRNREIYELLDLLIAERIVLLHSPSGAGKSSLIQAGLIPELKREGFEVLPLIRLNLEPPAGLRDDPLFNRYIYSVLVSLQEFLPEKDRLPPAALAQMKLEAYLEDCIPRPSGEDEQGKQNQVLIFDQFEELLTLDPTQRDEKAAFISELGAVLRNRTRWVLFSMREDFLAALDPYLRPIPTRLHTTFRLDFLAKDAAYQAIHQPAGQVGVNFSPAAVQKLVDDLCRVQVQHPDGSIEVQQGLYVEPVQLQVVCYRLWEHLPPGTREIQPQDIEAVGDVDTALSAYYAERVAAVAGRTQVGERLIRDWFELHLITPSGIRSQVLMGKDTSEGLDNRAIWMLEDAHLVRGEKRGGTTWFELAHDRLINPVRMDNLAWFQAHLSLFQRQAVVWDKEKRPDSLLLRGKDLDEAEAWVQEQQAELTEAETAFLAAGQELRQREEETHQLEEAQQVAETERQRAELQARSAKQLRWLAMIIAGALVVAISTTILAGFFWQKSQITAEFNAGLAATNATIAAENAVFASTNAAIASTAQSASTQAVAQKVTAEAASIFADEQRQTAQAASLLANDQKATAEYNAGVAEVKSEEALVQASLAFSRQLASQSLGYVESRPDLSLLLGVEAFRSADTLEARSSLLIGLQQGLSKVVSRFGRQVPFDQTIITSVAISPAGDRLAWGNADGEIVVWNYSQAEVEQRYQPHQGIVWGLDFSQDGTRLASAGNDSSIIIHTLSTQENDRLQNINKVLAVSWSPDGRRLAAAVGPHVMIWNLADTGEPEVDQNIEVDVNDVAWSPDGSMVAAATSFPSVIVLDPETGAINQTIREFTAKVKTVAWSPDSRRLASGGEDRLVMVWDVETGDRIGEPLKAHFDEVTAVSISHDGNVLASSSNDGSIMLWDMKTLQPLDKPLANHTSFVTDLAFIQRGGPVILASGSRDKSVQMVEVTTEQPLRQPLSTVTGEVRALGVEASGALLAGTLNGSNVDVWNVQARQGEPVEASPAQAGSMALSLDSQMLAVGDASGNVTIFETQSGVKSFAFDTLQGAVLALAYSPDRRRLVTAHCAARGTASDQAVCTQNEIFIWDSATGEQVGAPLSGHVDEITALAFTTDGKLLASGSKDKTIRLWDLEAGKEASLPLARHLDLISSLAISPDGKLLASSSDDNTIILWDLTNGQVIGEPLAGSPGSALSLVFTPDSKVLYSGYAGGEILAWDVDVEAWMQRACRLAGRNMTTEEWQQFFRFSQVAYRQTCDQFSLATAGSTP